MFRGAVIEKVIDKFVRVLDEDDFYSVIKDDLKDAKKSLLIFSPFVDIRRDHTRKFLSAIKDAVNRGISVKVVVKPDVHPKALKALREVGAEIYKRDTHVKVVIIDDYKVVYIGSLNVLASYGKEDVMLRITGLTGKIIPKILSKKLFKEIKTLREEEKI